MTASAPITQDVHTIPRKLPDGPINLVCLTRDGLRTALIEAGTRRKRRKEVVDKLAAQIMLQHYLDARGGGEEWNDGMME